MVPHNDTDIYVNCNRERALYAIAVAQAKAGRVSDAVATALAIQYYPQYKNQALLEIADVQLSRGNQKGATDTADKITDSSTKAIAFLTIAVAYAKSGEKETARNIAGQIHLVEQSMLPLKRPTQFEYRRPETWGHLYDKSASFGTIASRLGAVKEAQRLAGAAMTLAQALGESHHERYAEMLKDIRWPEIVRAIARAHAASGNAREALAWASRIGSDKKIDARDDQDARIRVEQRISALVGVAEGILDSSIACSNGGDS